LRSRSDYDSIGCFDRQDKAPPFAEGWRFGAGRACDCGCGVVRPLNEGRCLQGNFARRVRKMQDQDPDQDHDPEYGLPMYAPLYALLILAGIVAVIGGAVWAIWRAIF
jgi:hypothetical protein